MYTVYVYTYVYNRRSSLGAEELLVLGSVRSVNR